MALVVTVPPKLAFPTTPSPPAVLIAPVVVLVELVELFRDVSMPRR